MLKSGRGQTQCSPSLSGEELLPAQQCGRASQDFRKPEALNDWCMVTGVHADKPESQGDIRFGIHR